MTTWAIEGPYLKTCNCDPGCPCDFNQAPTHGHCHGCFGMRIDSGHFGDVSLDGLHYMGLVRFPGRMDEGDGNIQWIIDSSASSEQKEALEEIFGGRAGGTIFEILDVVCPHKNETILAPFEFEWDLDSREAHVKAGDVLETRSEPLRGIDPPDPYRIRVVIPGGFEYTNDEGLAEVGSATQVRAAAAIDMDIRNGHSSLCHARFTGEVPVAA